MRKKKVRRVICAILVFALVGVAALMGTAYALAESPRGSGLFDLKIQDDTHLTVTPLRTGDIAATAGSARSLRMGGITYTGTYYEDAEKLRLCYTGAAEGEECFLLVSSQGEPSGLTDASVIYMDQVTAASQGAAFLLYPGEMTDGAEYYIYISTASAAIQRVASFRYYQAALPLGDVNGDYRVNAQDLTLLARYLDGKTSVLIETGQADVDGDKAITVLDLTRLSRFVARIVDTLE